MPRKIKKSRAVEHVLMKARPKPAASPPLETSEYGPAQTKKKKVKWVATGCQKYNREEEESSEIASAAVSSSEERKQVLIYPLERHWPSARMCPSAFFCAGNLISRSQLSYYFSNTVSISLV